MQPSDVPTESTQVQPVQVEQATVQPEQPASAAPETHTKKIPRQRHFLILFFFSFMWGAFGVDRMYMGLYGTGILKLLTFGGLGFWAMTDMIVIMTGTFRDKQGRLTLQSDEYKKFAGRTIFWFSIILGLVILINGALFILGIYQLVNSAQSGSLQIPGLSQIQNAINQQSATTGY